MVYRIVHSVHNMTLFIHTQKLLSVKCSGLMTFCVPLNVVIALFKKKNEEIRKLIA